MRHRSTTLEERKALGERLRQTAQAAGFTSDSIAERLGIQGGSVRGWWVGRNAPSFARLRQYADLVKVSVSYLLTGSQSPMGSHGTLQEWRLR
ncbi:MAG TPA: helix-turn-helix transcriptional regulator, partial [Gemmatimonadales bacterium]